MNIFSSTSAPGLPTKPDASPRSQTEEDFLGFRQVLARQYLEWTEMPEEKRIRHQYLEKHGLTETSLSALSPLDRAAHEMKIAELSKQPVLSNSVIAHADGDSLTRPVVTLQSVLAISDGESEATATDAASGTS